jgi:hypothetical protein
VALSFLARGNHTAWAGGEQAASVGAQQFDRRGVLYILSWLVVVHITYVCGATGFIGGLGATREEGYLYDYPTVS